MDKTDDREEGMEENGIVDVTASFCNQITKVCRLRLFVTYHYTVQPLFQSTAILQQCRHQHLFQERMKALKDARSTTATRLTS